VPASPAVPLSRRQFLATAAAAVCVPSQVRTPSLAMAPAGRFHGACDGPVHAFLGIRYGRAERFAAPSAEADAGDLVATRFGPIAPQRGVSSEAADEDCLFLNVWSPAPDPRAARAVMVYFHGGAYSNGTVTDPLTHGAMLAERGDVVVVTVNHRLNAFGYLYLDQLGESWSGSGNRGQQDLLLALQWIQRNIVAFGGDARRVMLFGQSGGGAKIATLMAMPQATGLFARAASMSGQQVTLSGPAHAAHRSAMLFDALRLAPQDSASLVRMPWQQLTEALSIADPYTPGSLYFGPVLDASVLHRHPFWPDAAPLARRIPMILGNTRDETRAFIDARDERLRGLTWENLAGRIQPEIRIDLPPAAVVRFYRQLHPEWSAQRAFYAITTDGRSWPGQWIEAEVRAAAGAAPTWVYRFDRNSPRDATRGAAHTDDIPHVFGTLEAPGSFSDASAASRQTSALLMGAFTSFARTGRPVVPGVSWDPYTQAARRTLLVDANARMADDPRGAEREFWARAPYIQPGS
jgi:para-nitrobenzyl esterase